ncbi:MAG: hypothetical protein ACYDH9_09220 [Limisphaerales bacterium]
MRRLLAVAVLFGLVGLLSGLARADEFKLTNDDVLKGAPVSFTEDGMVVRLDIGGFSERVAWIRFTQEALKRIAEDPKAKPFVEPFIEVPVEEKAKKEARKKEIIVRPVTRVELPTGNVGLLGDIRTPVGFAIVLLLLAANVYGGFEIAQYRHQPVALVCGLSALLPVVAPILFLSLPGRAMSSEGGEAPAQPGPEGAGTGPEGASATSRLKKKITGAAPPPGGGLTLAASEKPAASQTGAEPKMFRRGDYTFNRRFFETQFPGFFRIVPSEAEKNLVLVIKGGRGEFVGRRISRVGGNELHLQLLNSTSEVMITFGEISEVVVRNKDAKA